MGINRRKQSKERSKGLLTFSASVGMEKLIFPSSRTEGTIALCFLKDTCPRKLTEELTAWSGFFVWWEHLDPVLVRMWDVYKDLGKLCAAFLS